MSYLTALGAVNGVGLGLGWVCVQWLTPVIAARFDVFLNVVLCCSLFMHILIKIKGKLNKPSDVRDTLFFHSYSCPFHFFPKRCAVQLTCPPYDCALQ